MQPNEQDPGQQTPIAPAPNTAQPLPYAVPEYLHLDPVTGQAKRSFKKPILMTLGALLIVSGIGFIGYQVWQYNQPQAQFYRVLENNFKVSYVERVYDVTYNGSAYSAKLQADAKTDFTKPAIPKSSVGSQYTNNGIIYKADYVMPSSDKYMALIHEGLPNSSTNLTSNHWYQMAYNSMSAAKVTYALDQIPIKPMLNTSQGLLPLGNFSADQRSHLMDYIKTHDIYTVTKSESQQNTTTYTITLNVDALNGLNQEIANTLSVKQVYVASKFLSKPSKIAITVDNKLERVKQTLYTVPNGNSFSFQGIVDYSYPTNVSIAVPNDTTSLPGGINL